MFRFGIWMTLIFVVYPCHAYIEEGLVNYDQGSFMGNLSPLVAASDSEVWVIWYRYSPEGSGWWFTRWDGDVWEHEQKVIFNGYSGLGISQMKIAMDDMGRPHLAWTGSIEGYSQIFYSTWDSSSWNQPEQVTFDQNDRHHPDIALTPEGFPWIVWSQLNQQSGRPDIWSATKSQSGWHNPQAVEQDGEITDWYPSVACDNESKPYVIWQRYDSPEFQDICYSIREGSEWGPVSYLTSTDDEYEQFPRIAIGSDGIPWAVWQTSLFSEATRRILSARWTVLGWENTGQVSELDTMLNLEPRICIDIHNNPWITWWSSSSDVYLCGFEEGEWGENRQVTNPDSLVDFIPDIATDGEGIVWIVWEGGQFYEGSDNDIFYGRLDPTAVQDLVSKEYQLVCNPFPNPSSSVVTFPLESGLSDNVQLRIYDIGGHLIRKMHSNSANGSNDYLIWDGLDHKRMRVSPGTYLCALSSGDQRVVRRVVVNR